MMGVGREADIFGAKAFSLSQSVLLPQREKDLPGRNSTSSAIYTGALGRRRARAEGGGHTAVFCQSRQLGGPPRQEGQGGGGLTASCVAPSPPRSLNQKNTTAPAPHFPICCGRRLCRVGSWPEAKWAPSLGWWGDEDAITPRRSWRGRKMGAQNPHHCAGSPGWGLV